MLQLGKRQTPPCLAPSESSMNILELLNCCHGKFALSADISTVLPSFSSQIVAASVSVAGVRWLPNLRIATATVTAASCDHIEILPRNSLRNTSMASASNCTPCLCHTTTVMLLLLRKIGRMVLLSLLAGWQGTGDCLRLADSTTSPCLSRKRLHSTGGARPGFAALASFIVHRTGPKPFAKQSSACAGRGWRP